MTQVIDYILTINPYEAAGLIFGLLSVIFLIKENIWTWPAGIAYVLVSFVIFWQEKLYGDFILHIVFLVLNIYGWWFWVAGSKKSEEEVPITHSSTKYLVITSLLSILGIIVFGYIMERWTDNLMPYWDASTTVLSLFGMWLTARKKIDNWYFWFIVDVLATGIYFYKGIQFYGLLYLIYIGLAISGYLTWRKTMLAQ